MGQMHMLLADPSTAAQALHIIEVGAEHGVFIDVAQRRWHAADGRSGTTEPFSSVPAMSPLRPPPREPDFDEEDDFDFGDLSMAIASAALEPTDAAAEPASFSWPVGGSGAPSSSLGGGPGACGGGLRLGESVLEQSFLSQPAASQRRALSSLTTDEVVRTLDGLDLGRYGGAMRTYGVSGADLALATDDDLRELGVGLSVHRKRLLGLVAQLVADGVDVRLLDEPRSGALGGEAGGDGFGAASEVEVEVVGAIAPKQADDSLCVICLDKPRSFVLLPCGHLCTCAECTGKLVNSLCPICRGPVDAVHKVFT
jgi:hypothetical protein